MVCLKMPINPKCDKCSKELNDFGGIILSPPINCSDN